MAQFIRLLACSRAHSAPPLLRVGATAIYVSRLFAPSTDRAAVASLLSPLLGNAAKIDIDGVVLDLGDLLAEDPAAVPPDMCGRALSLGFLPRC